MTNETIRNMCGRRSCRSFSDRQISDCELNLILESGLHAPSGMNRQSVILVSVRDRDTVKKLSKMNAAVMGSSNDPFYGAPCVVVVLAKAGMTALEDGSLAMGNMLNAAYSLGLGCCWIHRAKEMFLSPEGKELLKGWGITDDIIGVGNCILGYPAENADVKEIKPGRIINID